MQIPDADGGKWSVVGHWMEVDGREQCVGLEIWRGLVPSEMPVTHQAFAGYRSRPPDRGLTSKDFRSLPIATILRELVAIQHMHVGGIIESSKRVATAYKKFLRQGASSNSEYKAQAKVIDDQLARIVTSASEAFATNRKRGFNPIEVAAVYQDALRGYGNPTTAVAEHFHVSLSTATKWAARCRKEGALLPTTPGKPSPIEAPPPPARRRKR
jgi:hypothetical protein